MNRHQVLTGAANNFDYSLSIGSVENTFFTVINYQFLAYFHLLLLQFVYKKKGIWIRI